MAGTKCVFGRLVSVFLLSLGSLAGGCAAHRALPVDAAYVVKPIAGRDFLFPPGSGVQTPSGSRLTIEFHRFGARKKSDRRVECSIQGQWFSFQPKAPGSLDWVAGVPTPGPWLMHGSMNLRDDWTEFVAKLHQAEEAGCFAPKTDMAVERLIAQQMPLPTGESQFFDYWYGSRGGQFDLNVGMHLRVERALFRDASANKEDIQNLIAVRTALYLVRLTGEKTIYLRRESLTYDPAGARLPRLPDAPDLRLDSEFGKAAALRIFLLSDFVPQAIRRVAILVGARDTHALDGVTDTIHANPHVTCDQLKMPGVVCQTFTGSVTVTADLGVTLQGQTQFFSLGSNLGAALPGGPGLDQTAFLTKLHLQRLFLGHYADVEFPPGDADILKMALVGGDRITF